MERDIRGQIWVETVIYTLITLTIIGAVLAFILPRVEEIRDKSIIDQSISVMEDIDSTLLSVVQGGVGNKRIIDLTIRKGSLTINGTGNQILFEMESSYAYGEIDRNISIGNIITRTEQTGSAFNVILTQNYNYNLTYDNEEAGKAVTQSSVPYKLQIENKGKDASGNTVVNVVAN